MTVAGMRRVTLDAAGRLLELRAVPPETRSDTGSPATPAWDPLLEAAGLDQSPLPSVPPQWGPREFSGATAAESKCSIPALSAAKPAESQGSAQTRALMTAMARAVTNPNP